MLIDTSGFFALNSLKDHQHVLALGLFDSARTRLTTNYILAEYVALGISRGLPQPDVIAFSEKILNDTSIEIVWIGEEVHIQAVELLRNRPDKTYSLCDAVSFAVMKDRGLTQALTTDRHFEQEGFIKLLG